MGPTRQRSFTPSTNLSRRPRHVSTLVAALLACALVAGAVGIWRYRAGSSEASRVETSKRDAPHSRAALGGSAVATAAVSTQDTTRPSSWCYAWTPGRRSVYGVTQRSRVTLQPPSSAAARRPSKETVLQVSGELHQLVYQRDRESAMLALTMPKPTISLEGDTPGPVTSELDQLRSDLSQPIFVRVRLNRRVDRFYYRQDVNPLAANVLRSVFLASQIVLPGCDGAREGVSTGAGNALTWETKEENTTGRYVARYEAEPDWQQVDIYKRKRRFLAVHLDGQLAGSPGASSSAEVKPGTYALASYSPTAQALTRVEDVDEVRVRSSGMVVDARVETQLELIDQSDEAIDVYADAGQLIRELRLQSSSAVEGRLSPGQQRALWHRTVGGAQPEELLEQVRTLDGSTPGAAQHALFRKLSAYYNLHPQQLGDLTDSILGLSEADPHYADQLALLSGVFTNVQHAAAEQTLLALINIAQHKPRVLAQAVGALGDVPVASQAAVGALRQLHEAGARPETRAQALLALGSLAHRAGRAVPEVRTEATEYLLQRLEGAADVAQRQESLAALGNAGATEAFTAIAAELDSTSPQRRAAAVYELRRLPGEQVDETLRRFVRDETNSSALEEGLKALRYRGSVENLQTAIDAFRNAPSDRVRTAALQATADLSHVDRQRAMSLLQQIENSDQGYSQPVHKLARDLAQAL